MTFNVAILGGLLVLVAPGCSQSPLPTPTSPATSTGEKSEVGPVPERPIADAGTSASDRVQTLVSSDVPGDAAQPSWPAGEDRSPAVSIDTSMFFANLRVTRDTTLSPLELRLHAQLSDGPFGELTRRKLGENLRNQRILLRLPATYPTDRGPVLSQHRACSYVIDCDAEAVRQLGQSQLSAQPTVEQLVGFTSRHIAKKSLSRGFDIASSVAVSREGDCTEHAVLLTALARKYHLAARVVFGFAVIRQSDHLPILVGHAWSEIHDGSRWQLADAALHGVKLEHISGVVGLSYVPVQLLKREDAGFRAELLTEPGFWQIDAAEANF